MTNVGKTFYWGPHITTEVSYNEYDKVYDSVTKNCQGKLIVEAAPLSPFIAEFHGVDVDYVLSTLNNLEQDELFLYDDKTGRYNTMWRGVPVITDLKELNLAG